MQARKPIQVQKPGRARHLSVWLWAAVVAVVVMTFGAVGCRSTASSGGKDTCGSGCTGH